MKRDWIWWVGFYVSYPLRIFLVASAAICVILASIIMCAYPSGWEILDELILNRDE